MVNYDENPVISEEVVFDLITADEDGTSIDPYRIDKITIYYIERGYSADNSFFIDRDIGEETYTNYYSQAIPVAVFGNDENPTWIVSDPDNGFVEKIDYDEDDEPQTGVFRLIWRPWESHAREGDYVLCYKWTPLLAGDAISKRIHFYLLGDTKETTGSPTQVTTEGKYELLLERFVPDSFKQKLFDADLTPDIIDRLHQSIAKGFTTLENLANQIVSLLDANALNSFMIPYLASLFRLRLKTIDPTMWRRQIYTAVTNYKKKGTLSGLKEALAASDIKFKKLTRLWQVVSAATWQEAFKVTSEDQLVFTLSKLAILPVDENFEVYIRFVGTNSYMELSLDYVSFENADGVTTMTWKGENLSVNPISLDVGDFIRVIYKIAEPVDQAIENYIRTLPLSDKRDEVSVTYPAKNWNVRLIEEDDDMFSSVCPVLHGFQYPVVFGKIRTEFAYSENIYNMDEYNGSIRDSTDPCHIDKDFYDICSCCISSKFNIDIEIEDLSTDRLEEAEEIIRDFVPFHAVVNTINYKGMKNEFIMSPEEEIEILVQYKLNDNVIMTQMNFNRLIEEGSSDELELKRNMLADTTATSHTGTGTNTAIVMFSPGVRFDTLGIDPGGVNLLEILSGTDQGEYKLGTANQFIIDIVQGDPDTINFPLNTSSFPYRISNILYTQSSSSIYQNDEYVFSDSEVTFINLGVIDSWRVVITAGVYAGTYEIDTVNPDNTLTIIGLSGTSTVSSITYDIRTASNVVVHSGTTGKVTVKRRGRLEISQVTEELSIKPTHYVLYSSNQYEILKIVREGSVDKVFIENYSDGDVVGSANVKILDRLVDNGIGYLDLRGMELTGTVPTLDDDFEVNKFLENYLILIGTDYYKIAEISGSKMLLSGSPLLEWGLSGVSVNYSIVQFIKTENITTQDGTVFDRLDRRGNDVIVIETETDNDASLAMSLFSGKPLQEVMTQTEQIWITVESR